MNRLDLVLAHADPQTSAQSLWCVALAALFDGKFTTWEGGIREPAAVRWKGTVPPGRISSALVATYDIFATIIALAKAPAPEHVVLDGKDLTQVLISDAPSPHRCLMFYHSPQSNEANTSGVAAVRCGDYKAHFFTHSTEPESKRPVPDGVHDPPIIFNLASDIGESKPLDLTSPDVAAAHTEIVAAMKAHLATVDLVPNQMIGSAACTNSGTTAPSCVGGNDIDLAICKDPNSKADWPQWPNCTSTPQYYGSEECREKNRRKCIANCMPAGEQ